MIIIPARLSSTRFPNKVLADIGSLPMIVRTAKNAQKIDKVCVACDDEQILEVCKKFDIQAILTSKLHNSGTDRCNEAAQILNLQDDEIIINIQADEPFLESSVIEELLKIMQNGAWMGSCAKIISQDEISDCNLVKVVLNHKNEALYFSRAPIPFNRDNTKCVYYGHLGVYGFRVKSLREFCSFGISTLEEIEKLEQLRALYNGKQIQMAIVQTNSIGIDTPEDLRRAKEMFL